MGCFVLFCHGTLLLVLICRAGIERRTLLPVLICRAWVERPALQPVFICPAGIELAAAIVLGTRTRGASCEVVIACEQNESDTAQRQKQVLHCLVVVAYVHSFARVTQCERGRARDRANVGVHTPLAWHGRQKMSERSEAKILLALHIGES